MLTNLLDSQAQIINKPLNARLFVRGPAGCGKSTVGAQRLVHLLRQGVSPQRALVFTPQRTLAAPYLAALAHVRDLPAPVTMLTLAGLAVRMVNLFWPVIAEPAGFDPERQPTFLTVETAQYYMAHIAGPKRAQHGFFASLSIDPNRLYTQLLDNLNKAALVGFPLTEIAPRLQAAWQGEPAQQRVYAEAQACALDFRAFCRQHNLLDFSLQVETFLQHVWPLPLCRDYLLSTYQHLIVDNVEEDAPVAHDLLRAWMPHAASALLIADEDGGYRQILGADPASGYALADLCDATLTLNDSFITPPALQAVLGGLHLALTSQLHPTARLPTPADLTALTARETRLYPDMIRQVGETVQTLLAEGVPPGEIAIVAPYLSDSLRFALTDDLRARGVPAVTDRPSRALRDEPATQAMLTLAALAHPAWPADLRPNRFEASYLWMQALGADWVRAQLLAEIAYRLSAPDTASALAPFGGIKPDMQARLTYTLGERYETLRRWLAEYQAEPQELDVFLGRAFGEVLTQPGFGFAGDFDAGATVSKLVESVRKFRAVAQPALAVTGQSLGAHYVRLVREGVIAAQYPAEAALNAEAVWLLPAFTFLMRNRAVRHQIWLDVGAPGWFERLQQPLTHPFVLSRRWPPNRVWTDDDEFAVSRATLARLTAGLLRRCREKVWLWQCGLGESGYEQSGPLLRAVNAMLKRAQRHTEAV